MTAPTHGGISCRGRCSGIIKPVLGDVIVRSATASDAAACAAIYAPYVLATVISFETVPPTVSEMAIRMERAQVWLVAECAGEPVGYAYASSHRERAAYRYAVDFAVYAEERARGRGIGRALYQRLIVECRDRGFHRAYGGISLPNAASVRLHEAVGFRPVGVYERVGWKLGAWHDVGWWQLDLIDPEVMPDDA